MDGGAFPPLARSPTVESQGALFTGIATTHQKGRFFERAFMQRDACPDTPPRAPVGYSINGREEMEESNVDDGVGVRAGASVYFIIRTAMCASQACMHTCTHAHTHASYVHVCVRI